MADQKTLREFLKRRHPGYDGLISHWNFLEATYEGGRDWFGANIFKYVKEGETEFDERKRRAYRFNHTREAVDLVQKYIFKAPITRNEEDAPAEVTAFWENATLAGLDISQFMEFVSQRASVFGMPWIFTDTTKRVDALSVADEKATGARVYAYVVKPQNILDVGFDTELGYTWVLVRETYRDDADPITSSGAQKDRYRLWTREDWRLFEVEESKDGQEPVVRLVDQGPHDLKRVPGFPVKNVPGDDPYTAPALISDIAYLDRAVANYLSNLDAIIQDQTFSQLAMPAQAVLPGEKTYDALIEAGTKRVFVYDGEGGRAPEYISPDPKQAMLIIAVVNKIIAEIYHTIGMAGERTKQDNAVGIDNSSGVAKAYDFERVNALLADKAHSLENAENELAALVCLWNKKPIPPKELVKYPDSFDVRNLFDEFTIAERLALMDAPKGLRSEQMKQVIDKLFPRISEDLRKKLEGELEDWPITMADMMVSGTITGNPPKGFPAKATVTSGAAGSPTPPANKNPATKSRQGTVTSKTK